MQPPYTQQAYVQYPSTPSHNPGPGYYPPAPSHPGATDFGTPVFSRRVAPSYNAQLYTTARDIYNLRYQPAVTGPTGPAGYGNDVYGGDPIPCYGPCHAMPGSWGTPAPQPLQRSDYPMPSILYTNFRQASGDPYYVGHPHSTEQVSSRFSSHLPGADPNQDGASEWGFHTQEDETHLIYDDDAYGGGSTSGHGSNHAMTGFWGTPAPQPLQHSGYPMVTPSIPYYSNGEPYDAGYHYNTEQVPGPSVNFSPQWPHLLEADSNQNVSSEWPFRTCRQPYGET